MEESGALCEHPTADKEALLDRIEGCLVGGAVGDALGYEVEFMQLSAIRNKYGQSGITEYSRKDGLALVSDDTQMTLFTANGLFVADVEGEGDGPSHYLKRIGDAYRDWYATQTAGGTGKISWLNNVAGMQARRAPGNTCLSALASPRLGSVEAPLNNSKGCGGVMRVAPVGLLFSPDRLNPDQTAMLGAQAAALTHGHDLGYIPAAMLAVIVQTLVYNPDATVRDAYQEARESARRLFSDAPHFQNLLELTDRAVSLSESREMAPESAIQELGEGWVAEETLAIALYCALRFEHDFDAAIIASVNHDGDSDSTGAVCGNILGARLGVEKISGKWRTDLEHCDVILEIANHIYGAASREDDSWREKYVLRER